MAKPQKMMSGVNSRSTVWLRETNISTQQNFDIQFMINVQPMHASKTDGIGSTEHMMGDEVVEKHMPKYVTIMLNLGP
jgi:hypothetical protein